MIEALKRVDEYFAQKTKTLCPEQMRGKYKKNHGYVDARDDYYEVWREVRRALRAAGENP